MYEPDYQTHGIHETEVIRLLRKSWFYTELQMSTHTQESEKKLHQYLNKTHGVDPVFKTITFDGIQKVNGWKEICDTILGEEVEKAKQSGFGSYRGYVTYVHDQLVKNYVSRVINEIWATEKTSIKLTISNYL